MNEITPDPNQKNEIRNISMIHDDFAYLGEVLQSDLSPSAKLFFASLILLRRSRNQSG